MGFKVGLSVLLVLGLGVLMELLLLIIITPLLKKIVSASTATFLLLSSIVFWQIMPLWLFVLLGVASVYRIINIARLLKARSNTKFLYSQSLSSLIYLAGVQTCLVVVAIVNYEYLSLGGDDFMLLLVSMQFTVAFLIAYATVKNLFLVTHPSTPRTTAYQKDLPTVSVLIPARNETEYLAPCIKSVLDSDYPKLEIIVLDDCSQDKTSDIIKLFAQKGVRFIDGEPPPEKWLAKNYAYHQLASHASGELLVFLGVDAHIETTTIFRVVSYMQLENKKMLSVLPSRAEKSLVNALIQPMRYWLEIALPRIKKTRPPVVSTFWAIDKVAYKKLGSFKSVSRTILPENYFAREIQKTKSYAFVNRFSGFGVMTHKRLTDQFDTAIRTRYPQLKRSLGQLFIFTWLELLLLIAPFIFLPAGLISQGFSAITILILLSVLLIALSHGLVNIVSKTPGWYLSTLTFPVVVAIDICVTHISMYKYEFSEVLWKGRNICLPVMHIVPKLPDG